MKKLTLDLDALAVDTFATGEKDDARGTMRGQADTLWACPLPSPSDGGKTCITCNAPTDPCLCDPIHTEIEG
ncbi:MAG TPA: hypothetical protein VFQ39_00880 [Longimicrobium sp.]|nr:hypothetical protein [Longimicrobium sp.]